VRSQSTGDRGGPRAQAPCAQRAHTQFTLALFSRQSPPALPISWPSTPKPTRPKRERYAQQRNHPWFLWPNHVRVLCPTTLQTQPVPSQKLYFLLLLTGDVEVCILLTNLGNVPSWHFFSLFPSVEMPFPSPFFYPVPTYVRMCPPEMFVTCSAYEDRQPSRRCCHICCQSSCPLSLTSTAPHRTLLPW